MSWNNEKHYQKKKFNPTSFSNICFYVNITENIHGIHETGHKKQRSTLKLDDGI